MKEKMNRNVTINLNKIWVMPGGKRVNGYVESFRTVEEAESAGRYYLADHPDHKCEVVLVDNNIESPTYCEIVEVVKCL